MKEDEVKKDINKIGRHLEKNYGDCVLIVAKDVVTLFSTKKIDLKRK